MKYLIKQRNFVLNEEYDLVENVYGTKLDERVGYKVFYSSETNNYLTITGMHAETDYVLCGIFENEFKVSSEQVCVELTT